MSTQLETETETGVVGSSAVVESSGVAEKKAMRPKSWKPESYPKPAITVYRLFCEKYKLVAEEKGTKVTRTDMNSAWNSMSVEERKEKFADCYECAAKDKERFKREQTEWEENPANRDELARMREGKESRKRARKPGLTIAGTKVASGDEAPRKESPATAKSKKKKKVKRSDVPKRGRSAYNFFMAAKSKEFEGGVGQRSGPISALWKSLTDEERKPFLDLAATDKERYAREVKLFEQNQLCSMITVVRTPVEEPSRDAKSYIVNRAHLTESEVSIFDTLNRRFLDDTEEDERNLLSKIESTRSFAMNEDTLFQSGQVQTVFVKRD